MFSRNGTRILRTTTRLRPTSSHGRWYSSHRADSDDEAPPKLPKDLGNAPGVTGLLIAASLAFGLGYAANAYRPKQELPFYSTGAFNAPKYASPTEMLKVSSTSN